MFKLFSFAVVISSLLIACSTQPISPAVVPIAEQEAIEIENRTLTICLGNEPETLYPLAAASRSAWSVLEAIYDGPVDIINGQPQPVILTSLPSRENGGISLTPVQVKTGDLVADTRGNLTSLAPGVRVFPSGCSSPDCATTWDGITPLTLDQLSARFTLKPGITWSDGAPLTADDALFSSEIASDPATPGRKSLAEQTAAYTVIDSQTLLWQGLPGLMVADVSPYFPLPLPRHAWGELSAADLLSAALSSREPIGWGGYVLAEWKAGESIRLVKNPRYFRAAEGLPKFDQLVFRFTGPTGDATMNNLRFDRVLFDRWNTLDVAKMPGYEQFACDLADSTSQWDDQIDFLKILLTYANQPAVKIFTNSGTDFSALLLNPAPNPDGTFNPFSSSIFRQAFSACLDRETALRKMFYTLTSIPPSYLPYQQDAGTSIKLGEAWDITAAESMFESLGWLDHDQNKNTTRSASGVTDVPDGTALQITISAPENILITQYMKALIASAQPCGLDIRIQTLPLSDYYNAQIPGSPLGSLWQAAVFNFGKVDLLPCIWLNQPQSSPLGIINIADDNLSNVCRAAGFENALHKEELFTLHGEIIRTLEKIDVLIPLYYKPKLVIARKDMCPIPALSQRSDLSALEEFNYSSACQ